MSDRKIDPIEELSMMRMSIKVMRDELNKNIDAIIDQVNRLMPVDETSHNEKYKNYTKEDWRNFLEF